MIGKIKKILEIGFARIVPGALNIYCLLLVAEKIQESQYGEFSTIFASATIAGNVIFGAIKQSILPKRSDFVALGTEKDFDQKLVGSSLIVSSAVFIIAFPLCFFGYLSFNIVLLVICIGLFSTLQPLLRAKLFFWSYGSAAISQATLLFLLIQFHAGSTLLVAEALNYYLGSYFLGALVSYIVSGLPRPSRPSRLQFMSMIRLGIPITLSRSAENGLQLGFRYALMFSNNSALLTSFSLALDMGQRVVGILLNIASFSILPRAYHNNAVTKSSSQDFSNALLRGTIFSSSLALITMLSFMAFVELELVPGIDQQSFSFIGFAFVSGGIIFSRIKRMLIDPISIKKGHQNLIPIGYFAAVPIAIGLGLIALKLENNIVFYASYFSGSFLAIILTQYLTHQYSKKNFAI